MAPLRRGAIIVGWQLNPGRLRLTTSVFCGSCPTGTRGGAPIRLIECVNELGFRHPTPTRHVELLRNLKKVGLRRIDEVVRDAIRLALPHHLERNQSST